MILNIRRTFHHLIFGCLIAAAGVAYPSESDAAFTAADKKHAESAFYFAERDNWHDAVLHAKRASNPLFQDYMVWRALKDASSNYDFAAFMHFFKRNPSWPDQTSLILRAEDKLYLEQNSIALNVREQWFKLYPPISGKGKLVYAATLAERAAKSGGKPQNYVMLIREAWRDGDFDAHQEKEILQKFSSILRQEDHIARADRLIWEGKTVAAGRILFAVPNGHEKLFEARIRLQNNRGGVSAAINKIPANLKNDPGLMYERMKWRERKELKSGVLEILKEAPKTIPYPHKWWRTRHIAVRDALESKQYKTAISLLENHGQVDGIGLADALWIKGWLQLTKLGDANNAYLNFKKMAESVQYPVSLSRGYYWMGRAAEKQGKQEEALADYARASAYSTTFYGQLAAEKLHRNPQLKIPVVGSVTNAQRQQFQTDGRVGVIRILATLGKLDETAPFFEQLLEDASNHADALLVAQLATQVGKQYLGVKVAKDALKKHMVLLQAGYPHYSLDFVPSIEPALMWAITRQESLFDPYAQSRAGAKGLMQLMPATARETARKMGMRYYSSQLNNARTNLQLGSYYLGSMIARFDGSYVLAIASYNAGPGRVQQWVKEFGYPGETPEQAIDWIERIPYSETRNYVQRVLENLQVYRAITGGRGQTHIQTEKDLTRWN